MGSRERADESLRHHFGTTTGAPALLARFASTTFAAIVNNYHFVCCLTGNAADDIGDRLFLVAGGESKVSGTLRGTFGAGPRIFATLVRVATERREKSSAEGKLTGARLPPLYRRFQASANRALEPFRSLIEGVRPV